MDESSPTKPQEKMSAKSGGTKSDNKAVGMAESSQTKPQKKMSTKSRGTKLGNMIHYTAKASIAHNFMRLKEGDIYSIKNFVVFPNKDEYRIFKHDNIMLEFDWETTVRKKAIFHCKVMIKNFKSKKGWNYPSCGFGKCRKGVTRTNGQFICEACNKAVDYPVFRYMIEVVVADNTARTVVVMFNDTTT
ncbi:nucleic acid-binding, OB-fold protein [Tanacetum coccineum]